MTHEYADSQNDPLAAQGYDVIEGYDRVRFKLERMAPVMERARSFLDLGCAKGELIAVFRKRWPDVEYFGVDASGRLLELARLHPPLAGVHFHKADVRGLTLGRRFDVVLASGLLGCFDEPRELFQVMLEHLEDRGTGFVFSTFNRGGLDTFVQFRTRQDGGKQAGLNAFGMDGIEKMLAGKTGRLQWHGFEIQTDLPRPSADNPTRSYTEKTADGRRLILSNIGVLLDFSLLEFTKAVDNAHR